MVYRDGLHVGTKGLEEDKKVASNIETELAAAAEMRLRGKERWGGENERVVMRFLDVIFGCIFFV